METFLLSSEIRFSTDSGGGGGGGRLHYWCRWCCIFLLLFWKRYSSYMCRTCKLCVFVRWLPCGGCTTGRCLWRACLHVHVYVYFLWEATKRFIIMEPSPSSTTFFLSYCVFTVVVFIWMSSCARLLPTAVFILRLLRIFSRRWEYKTAPWLIFFRAAVIAWLAYNLYSTLWELCFCFSAQNV